MEMEFAWNAFLLLRRALQVRRFKRRLDGRDRVRPRMRRREPVVLVLALPFSVALRCRCHGMQLVKTLLSQCDGCCQLVFLWGLSRKRCLSPLILAGQSRKR